MLKIFHCQVHCNVLSTLACDYILRTLKNNHDIVIKKTDKGSAIVIMDRDDYILEGERQLKETNFYRHVKEDMAEKFNDNVREIVSKMVKNKEITEEVGEFLDQENLELPSFISYQKSTKTLKSTRATNSISQ